MKDLKAIVCVDDEPSILSALQQQIMRAFNERFIIELAESGEEALDIIRDLNDTGIPLALVISDEMMPGMRGHMLIEQILNQSSKTHCILLTGYAASEIVNQITSQNPITCISKPWDAKELVALIKQVTQE